MEDPLFRTEYDDRGHAGWPALGQRGLLALVALAVLYCWGRGLTIWIAFGLHATSWKWIVGGLVGLLLVLVLVALAARQARGIPVARRRRWMLTATLAWILASVATWYAVCSPFSRNLSISLGFATTTLWLLWACLMFFVSWRWRFRLAFLVLAVAAVGIFLAGTKVTGWDGQALPMVTWTFAAPSVGSPALASESELSTDADDSERDEASAYPRFRNVDGLATVRGANLARDWARQPPRLRWRRAVGAGWGGLVVAGQHAFTQEQRGEDECVVSYDRHTGGELWVHRDTAHYRNPGAGEGPRATPTIDGQQVFALGATGILNALDRETGARQWTVNIVTDNEAQAPPHGTVGSPLVVGDSVVVCAGGLKGASLVAYDRATGKRGWHAGNDPAGYTSPLLVTIGDEPQILIVTTQNLHAHDPATGAILWTLPWANPQQTNCSQPFPAGDNGVFISSDYGTGCALIALTRGDRGRWAAEPAWTNRAMQTKFCSVVVHQGHAYSFDDEILECVSLADGRKCWKRGRYGHGQLLLADDLLVIQAEDGRVVLVEATPEAHRELAQFQALNGKTWNNPSLAGHQLYVRNDQEAACYELPTRDDAPVPAGSHAGGPGL